MENGLLQSQAAFRWVAWLWMAATPVVARDDLDRDWLAIGLVAALAVTVAATVLLCTGPDVLLRARRCWAPASRCSGPTPRRSWPGGAAWST